MKKEDRVILLGVLLKRTNSEQKELEEMLVGKLDWAYIVGQLFHHRVSGYFYYGLGDALRKYIMPEFQKSLELLIKAQEICNRERLFFLKETFTQFEKEGVRYSTLKGLTYSLTMYPYGIRRSNDCDILVLESDLKKVDKILLAQGYIQSSDGGETVAGKREKLIQIMNYHDLIPYYKDMDSQFQRRIKIDVNFHIDGKDNDITEKVFEYGTKLVEKEGYFGRVLDDKTHFIQLCIHFYREASNTIWVDKKRDLLLYKLVDIVNTVRFIGRDVLFQSIELSKQLNVDKQLYFVFYYLYQFYGDNIYQEFMSKFSYENFEFLRKIHVEGEDRDIVRKRDLVEETFDLYITNAEYLDKKR